MWFKKKANKEQEDTTDQLKQTLRPNHGQYVPDEPVETFTPEPEVPRFDESSAAWQYQIKYVERRINALHLENEKHISEVKTAAIRGRIEELRLLLKIPTRIRAGENLLEPPQS